MSTRNNESGISLWGLIRFPLWVRDGVNKLLADGLLFKYLRFRLRFESCVIKGARWVQ